MRAITLSVAALAVVLPAGLLSGIAAEAAAPAASVTVTIKAEGTDMSGTVSSTKPLKCAANRTVKVFKLVNGEPHLWASDTTEKQGAKYVWSTGNTGTEGRFYAKVGAKPGCKMDVSPTIRVVRPD
ncbi:hypothetical protein NSZ01_21860 [Nocardioides szechwanensis]|uniref:Ig-like domain-containing protein n=1 Tax=Nocardioides szechwanensis TaxID=1005944 RepID=A0A1H0I6Z6_9ACTN|nr:hypothetical protein [Nocardioides szechwanensis]GEP34418.1 hypothetical protein NSZ01_21860 [Nocardioides szechwanensis]SDO27219.1 hypothetical protein SAMN05192576_3708 [Nocardioides szechwanensis]